MADKRIDPDQVKRQFGEIWKQTMEQLDEFREVVVKAGQSARVRLDATFLRRERDRLYQQLGEDTFVLIESGKLKAPPMLGDLLDRIHVIGQQLEEAELGEEEGVDESVEPAKEAVSENGQKAAAGKAPAAKKAPRKAAKKPAAAKKKAGAGKKTAATKKKA